MKPEPSIPDTEESTFGWKIGTISLILIGLALRLWGLDWGGSAAAPHSAKIIDAIASGNLLYQVDPASPQWDYLYFFLVAVFKNLLWLVYGGFSVLFGTAPSMASVHIPTVMAARLLSALLGTATLWICIRLAQNAFKSRSAGFIAGALAAASPLLVAEAHYMDRGATSAFFAALCLLPVVDISRGASTLRYGFAGFLFGLACTVDARLATLIMPLLAAHFTGVFVNKEKRLSKLFGLPVVMAASAVVGLAVGFPPLLSGKVSFVELWMRAGQKIAAANPVWNGPWIDGPVASRLYENISLVGDAIGWVLMVVAVCGLGFALARKHWSGLWLALFALTMPTLQILWLGGSVESCQAMTLPALLCLAAVVPAALADRNYRAPMAVGMVTLLLAVLISLPSLWRTWAVGYLFWQEQPAQSAQTWAISNMPPDAQIYGGPHSPALRGIRAKALDKLPTDVDKASYVVLNSLDDDQNFKPWTGRAYDGAGDRSLMIRDNFILLKKFDIKGMPPRPDALGRRRFPQALSPSVLIYINKQRSAAAQPMGFVRPLSRANALRKVCYQGESGYSQDSTGMEFRGRPAKLDRTLRSGAKLNSATLELINRSSKTVGVSINQGPSHRESEQMEPGQLWRWEVQPANWPCSVPGVYPFSVVTEGGYVAGRIISDPLILGKQALQNMRWDLAASYLRQAHEKNPEAILPRALFAAALVEQGEEKGARRLLKGREQQLQQLARLALDQSPLDQWLTQLERFSGLDPVLLMRSLTVDMPVQMHLGRRVGGKMILNTRDISAVVSWPQNGQGPRTSVRIKHWLPAAPMTLRCKVIGSPGDLQGDSPAAHIALFRRDRKTRTKAVEADLSAQQLAGGDTVEVQLSVDPAHAADWWEVELESLQAVPLTISNISVEFDPRQQVRASARWALTAWGRLALADGNKDLARRILGDVALIDEGFIHAVLPHAQVLRDSGWPGASAERLRKAIKQFEHRPDMLQMARELARGLGDDKLGTDLADMLTALQPRKQHVVTFSKGIKLIGYDVESHGDDLGRKIQLRLYWQFDRTPPKDYRINCRLEGPAQLKLDHKFASGSLRMDQVRPGDIVVETIKGRIDQEGAHGPYRMVISLAPETKGSRRLMVLDGKLAGRRYAVIDGVTLP